LAAAAVTELLVFPSLWQKTSEDGNTALTEEWRGYKTAGTGSLLTWPYQTAG